MESAETRRIHIVYFLSRKGKIEHPHLIRVHHLSRNGVRLQDVKRWLGELRGKELSESFSWSYKRRYKTGYVWQDLLDDDLITPVSDNEYVLKGSEISSNVQDEKEKGSKQATTKKEDERRSSSDERKKSTSEIKEDDSSLTSTLAGYSDKPGGLYSSFYSTFLSKKKKKMEKSNAGVGSCKDPTPTEDGKNSSKSKMLKNLMSCGDVETKDSTMKKKISKNLVGTCSSEVEHVTSTALCTREAFGGSQRLFGNPIWDQQQFRTRMSFDGIECMVKNKSKSSELTAACGGGYKPLNGPNCSQCGKQFKPEKMQTHMESCKGLKASSTCSSKGKISVGSFSGHLFTH